MKVLYELQAYSFSPHGGVVRIFDETFARLAGRNGYQPLLFATSPLRRRPAAPNGSWVGIPFLSQVAAGGRLFSKPAAVADALYWRTKRPALLHPTFYPHHDAWASIPAVVHVYDLIHERIPQADDMPDRAAFLGVKRYWLTRAARLIAISEATKGDLIQAYPAIDPSRIRVVHPGFNPVFQPMPRSDAAAVAAKVWPDASRPFLLYVGGRARYKNFHRLLRAYAAWPRNKDIALLVVGGPPGQSDAAALDLVGTLPNLVWAGSVSDEVLRALYVLAEAFVYPSMMEGFGIPLLEAGQCGCRLCISDIPPFREVAGGRAVFFDPLDVGSIRAGLDRVLAADPATTCGPAKPAFTWDACAEGIWKVYQEVIG